jgi:hypothetical protein
MTSPTCQFVDLAGNVLLSLKVDKVFSSAFNRDVFLVPCVYTVRTSPIRCEKVPTDTNDSASHSLCILHCDVPQSDVVSKRTRTKLKKKPTLLQTPVRQPTVRQ